MRPLTAGTIRVAGRALRVGDPRPPFAPGSPTCPRTGSERGSRRASASRRTSCSSRTGAAQVSRGPFLLLRRIRDRAVDLIRRYDVRRPGPARRRDNLSGGNLQKLVLAREFRGEPKLLVVAAPTRGLDVGAIETVHAVPPRRGGRRRRGAPDQRGPRRGARARRPDRRHVRGGDRRRGRRACGDASTDRAAHGGRAVTRPTVRIERRLVQPAMARGGRARSARSWSRSCSIAVVLAADRPLAGLDVSGGCSTRRSSPTARSSTRSSPRRRSPSPGSRPRLAFRMQLFNIGGEGQLYFGAIGAVGIALLLAGQSGVRRSSRR